MRRSLSYILLAAMCVLLALPTAAAAQPATWQTVDVTLHSEQEGGMLLVSGELPKTASLPAEAELAVPAGSSIQWIGEILGGSPSEDPSLKYAKSTSGDVDVYHFTLTKSRIAQIEVPTATAVKSDGTNYSPSLTWKSAQDIPQVRVSVRVPETAKVVQPAEGAALQPGADGYKFYTKTVENVKSGDQLGLSFAYTASAAPAPASTQAASTSGSNSIAPIIVILIALIAAGGGAIAVRQKMALKSTNSGTGSGSTNTKGRTPGARVDAASVSESGPTAAKPAMSGAARRNLVTAGIIATIVVVALVVGTQTTKPKLTGDTITETFSQGQPCSNATIALKVPEGADPADTAKVLFTALRALPGMNTAKYNFKTSSIDVGFCESKGTESSVRQGLEPTGMVAQGGATAAPEPSAAAAAVSSGDGQAITVDTSSGSFSPAQITAKSGVPLEITFGQGSGCSAEVVFPELKIRQNLKNGPVTVKLGALDPGTYAFACGMDMQRGTLVVQ